MGAELSRILISLGAVAAWTGIIILGMGMSELVASADLVSKGQIVTVAGLIAFVVGLLMYRVTREPDLSSQ